MSGSTAVYGLRWQDLLDPPDGPNLGKHLAEDVEDELVRIDAVLDKNKYIVEVNASATQNVGTTFVALVLDTEVTDLWAMHAPASNTRLVAPIAGRYQIDAQWVTGSQSSGLNDTHIRANGSVEHWRQRRSSMNLATNYMNVSGTVVLAAAGYVEIMAACSSVTVATITPFARATMRYVGPV
jgi:hypothetical protein